MEGEEVGMTTARASQLLSKLNICIDKATRRETHVEEEEQQHESDHFNDSDSVDEASEADGDGTESLFHIRDALQSLEHQLVSFQVLQQQQQQYEREAALAEIDQSRKILLKKLGEYIGEDLEVIHEASTFASEKVEHNDDLLLPPYPSRSNPLVLDNGYPSHIPSASKYAQSGVTSCETINEVKKNTIELDRNQNQTGIRNSRAGVRSVINVAAKTVLTLVSVISVLNLAGFEPRLRKWDAHFNILDLFQKSATSGKSAMTQCPPGKVLVMGRWETSMPCEREG